MHFTDETSVQRCGVLTELPQLLRDLGADPKSAFSKFGFRESDFDSIDNSLPFAHAVALLEYCAQSTSCASLGILLGARGRLRHLGLVGQLMSCAPTLRQAIRDLVDNHHKYARGGAPYLIGSNGGIMVGYRFTVPMPGFRQFLLAALSFGNSLFFEVSGKRPSKVLVAHKRDEMAEDIEKAFSSVDVLFDQSHYALIYRDHVLDRRLPHDPAQRKRLEQSATDYWHMVEPDLVDRTRRFLPSVIALDRGHMELVSKALSLNPRTLNRRLKERGTSLRALVLQTRMEMARQLLRDTSLTSATIAETLGYSEISTFIRAFKNAIGAPPAIWRAGQSLEPSKGETADGGPAITSILY